MRQVSAASRRVELEDILVAYKETGSVWKAGKRLGIAGQTVHDRLRAAGVKMIGLRLWSDEELAELETLVGHVRLGEIADRLGRSYAAVACKINELDLAGKPRPRERKVPRGAGFDKRSTLAHVKVIRESGVKVSRYCRQRGLSVDLFVLAWQRYDADGWRGYCERHGTGEIKRCSYCSQEFVPANGKQRTCSRKCQADARRDASYFGGKRRNTVGLAEGVCQLCARRVAKGLSSHHVFGKENDPDNEVLVALCQGCHNLVTLTGGRPWATDETTWEQLISYAVFRRLNLDLDGKTVHVTVDIDIDDGEYDEGPGLLPGCDVAVWCDPVGSDVGGRA